MANNKPKVVEIIPPKNIWVGPVTAPVEIVMYVDYQSASCAQANSTVQKLLKAYPKEVRFNFRHFPLTKVHPYAHKAAEAAVAAAQEGKFWEMHQLLLSHPHQLGTISLKHYAKEAGVVNKNLLGELIDSKYGWTVRADLLDGLEKGVRDVPAVFINGQPYTGRVTLPEMTKAVEAELATRRPERA